MGKVDLGVIADEDIMDWLMGLLEKGLKISLLGGRGEAMSGQWNGRRFAFLMSGLTSTPVNTVSFISFLC